MKKIYTKFLLMGCFMFSILAFAQSPIKKADLKTSTRTLNPQIQSIDQQNTTPENIKESYQKIYNSYDHEKLKKLQLDFQERYSLRKAKVLDFALKNNIPTIVRGENGAYAELQGITFDGKPIYYTTYNVDAAVSTRADYLNSGGGLGLNLNGNGLTAHVWDGGLARTSHQEYDGPGGNNRFTASDGSTTSSSHAAHVTGTIIASGFQAAAKGMAPQARAFGYDWNNDVAEATAAAGSATTPLLVSNHSYGFSMRNQQTGQPWLPAGMIGGYIQESEDWDNLMYNAPYYLMFVAAGNDGGDNTANGSPLGGNGNYDKLNGHSCSKNNVVVANGNDANINGSGNLNTVTRNGSSSEGPTDDFRIKPDIMGNGTGLYSTYDNSNSAYNTITGTSMASPNVCGSALLLQEHYNNLNSNFMLAATLKGLILHTADDVVPGNSSGATASLTGPDATTGWGLMNSKVAAQTISTANAGGNAIIRELNLSNGDTYQITVQSDGVNPLLASISWTDQPIDGPDVINGAAAPVTNDPTPHLVNDLDLRVANGSLYTPWRLTGVNSNSTGDNLVDPFERVDINGASGQYTITISHKGNIGSGQNFSLIITGAQEVSATPQVGFNSTLGNTIEGSDCGFVDVQVPVSIAQVATQNADVSFTLNGGTATPGVDFDLMTSSMTFNAGSTASQNMMIRIYNDGFVEGDETFVVDLSVDANGGDASASSNANSITFVITDDDTVPIATQNVNILFEDFEDASGWTAFDADGDNENWSLVASGAHNYDGTHAVSYSWNGSAFTPNNYLISPAFTVPSNAVSTSVQYEIGSATDASFFSERYSVYFTTDISNEGTITGGIVLENNRQIPALGSETRSHDLSALAGQTGYFVVRHHNVTNQWWLGLDTVSIDAVISNNIQTTLNNGSTNDQINLSGFGTVYTSDSASDNLMLDITNNSTFDYGCVDIAVARAGTGAQDYNGSAAPNLVMDKTFYINPTNSSTSGDVSITFYFTEAEIAGWEAATGLSRTALTCLRDDAGAVTFAPDQNALNATETSNLTVGSFGTDVTLTGTFTGLTGGFVFGPNAAFQSLCFSPKVFLQGPLLTAGGTLMDDSLRAAGSIPTSSPYPDAVSAPAAVFNTTGNDAIVDWVWIELREVGNNTNVLVSTSALVQRDGDVVNYVDGTGTLKFGLADGNYILAIQHRNHLGVMSETLALDSACKVIDFTNGSIVTFGANAQTSFGLPTGISALWAGDVLGNNQIKFLGASNDGDSVKDLVLGAPANIFNDITYEYPGYFVNDVSLNGAAKFSGSSNDVDLIKDNVLAHPGNIFNDPTYTIVEQLP